MNILIDDKKYGYWTMTWVRGYIVIRVQGGESKGKFFMEQAKVTPRKELCESKVSVMSFLPCY